MLVSFEQIEVGQKFSSNEDDIYREFIKSNLGMALDEQGDEWLFMDPVSEIYKVLE